MDEAGEDDFVDINSYRVILPWDYPSETIEIPVRRSSKRSYLIHWISADGCYLKPSIISPKISGELLAKEIREKFGVEVTGRSINNYV